MAALAPLLAIACGFGKTAEAASPAPPPVLNGPDFGLFSPYFFLGDGTLGGFKISENESPRPTDRIFFNYNHFSSGTFHVNRETIGFEKTFLDGNASIGVRLPFIQDNFNSDIGDVSILLKATMFQDPGTGNLISGGLVVSLPTSGGSPEAQPFVGWIWQPPATNFFLQGFHSILIPTQFPDNAVLANGIGIGTVLPGFSGNQFVTGIVPTVELHLNSPVQHFDDSSLNLSAGGHIQFANGSSLGLGVGVPLTGPKPYDVEAVANFNFRF